ncbi:MAG: SDR family oxidoreductase [Gammaproteobacteria bacterium]|nr:SDR family oxidoreductase [Gammaproteobacteria bacterium]
MLITGASRGLGLALAQVFADAEYDLILHSKEKDIPYVKKEFNWNRELIKSGYDVDWTGIKGDLKEKSSLVKIQKIAEEKFSGLDVLIHCAGIHKANSFEKMNSDEYKESVDVNLLAPMYLTKCLWESVKKKQGLIVFINSIAGKVGAEKEFLYCAAKHGLKGFADSLQWDALKAGIKVVSFYLGAMQTDMCLHRKDYKKLMTTSDAAKLIYDVCKNYKSLRVTEVDVCRRIY